MKIIVKEKFERILTDHKIWLNTRFTYEVKGQKADLHKSNLSGANLSGADLREADLHKANLREADLHKANLREADLHKANLRGADLREADLHKANLRGANLCEADLCGANLSRADLCGTVLHGADLHKANMRGANLCEADLHETNNTLEERIYISIEKIILGKNGTLYVKPKGFSFDMIYRSAMGVYWDCERHCLYSNRPIDDEWGVLEWYKQIVAAVKNEYEKILKINKETTYENIDDTVKVIICAEV